MILNIGSGYNNRKQDEICVDIDMDCKPDVCCNIEKLPFKDDMFEEIKATHVLEHVDDIVAVLNECYRVMKPDGMFRIHVPMFPHPWSLADPTHKRYFVLDTFHYFVTPGALTGLKNVWKTSEIKHNDREIYAALYKD